MTEHFLRMNWSEKTDSGGWRAWVTCQCGWRGADWPVGSNHKNAFAAADKAVAEGRCHLAGEATA